MRPFLPPLLAGALASGQVGLDFDGTGYAFLESPAFLVAVFALAVLSYALDRVRRARPAGAAAIPETPAVLASGGEPTPESRTAAAARPHPPALRRDPVALSFAAVAVVLGALLFAGSLAAGDQEPWPGLVGGGACALLGVLAVTGLLDRVRRRLDESAAALLPAWADAGALALAGLAILFPPVALVGVVALGYLLVAGRRTRDSKYEGLRILR